VTETPVRPDGRAYPVRVDGELDPGLSRGLWLVKWLLAIPHYVVLAFLWVAFTVLSIVAFFAILITGRYPRALFDFNVGVLRWSWRVHYYSYGALGTDRYPPFTLADVPDYPAHLDVDYPERLSRGLVLVKWWLLAIPHYLVVAVFVGGGIWLGTRGGDDGVWDDSWGFGGLVALMVFIAAIVLLFTGRYPRPIYDFVLGMDRWVLRVAAYAGLMTDDYPPFRMDMGGTDPGTVARRPLPPPPPTGAVGPAGSTATAAAVGPMGSAGPTGSVGRTGGWSGGRIVSVVLGSVLLFAATGLLAGGGGLLWADQTQREDAYLWTSTVEIGTGSYALTSDRIELWTAGDDWVVDDVLGDARVEVTAVDGSTEVFVGVAPTTDVDAYLDGVRHRMLDDFGPGWRGRGSTLPGGAPEQPPGELDIWDASASGAGTQVLDWRPSDGDWTVVIMRADGDAGVAVDARAGITAPGLTWLAVGLLIGGGVLLVVGALLVALAVPRAHRTPPSDATPAYPAGPPPVPAGSGAPR
jgi:Domain of unknown function (DUF4389)